jgi:uncharacterized membrane protein YphA (DoxX/SURF4 family)
MNLNKNNQPENMAGLYTLVLRWVIGWTYFSAFWRRLILENKLIPEEAGYIGEKFNHFLPNALGIKPIIEYLVTHPEQLQTAMVTFTIVEAIVGLFLIFGLFTRAMSLGVMGLALGILLGSGWLGTTCLDEWQIGVLGIAGGFTLFLSGSDAYSVDQYLIRKNLRFTKSKWFIWLGSGKLPQTLMRIPILMVSLIIFGLTLFTNQYFHGGVLGKLHNKSVKPKVEIANINIDHDELQFEVYRVEGADVYGSFLIEINILNEKDEVIKSWDMEALANFPQPKINNHYVAKVKSGKHSLIIPLGAKADLKLDISDIELNNAYKIRLVDISGLEWVKEIK